MTKLRKLLIWTWLLTKRLYKKPSFLAILLLIPLAVVGYKFASQGESGMMTIAVCCEDPQDDFSKELSDQLTLSSGIIRFITDADVESAQQMVYEGTADAAWIIHKDLYDQMQLYVDGSCSGQGFVTVVIREETVPLLLANEKLSSKLFVQIARLCFLNYFRENAPEFNDISDEKILQNFDKERFEDSLFTFSYVDPDADNEQALNYLIIPVRGMLAILVLVSGLCASMYYISDEQDGLFARISLSQRPFVELSYQMICIGNVAFFTVAALLLSGWSAGLIKEIVSACVYVFSCAAFGRLIRSIFRKTGAVAVIMAVLTVVMLVVCPVFISVPQLKIPSLLFPPTYYIHAAYNWSYTLYMLIYGCVLGIVSHVAAHLFDK